MRPDVTDRLHGDGFLQADRAFTSATALRVGVANWLELSATVPAFVSERTRRTAPFQTASSSVSGFGDVTMQANARLHEQTADTPAVVLSLGTYLPTGVVPYSFSNYQPDPTAPAYKPNPRDLTAAAYFSNAAWSILSNLQLYKTIDSVILFVGSGPRYLFPRQVDGHIVQLGMIYAYYFGLRGCL